MTDEEFDEVEGKEISFDEEKKKSLAILDQITNVKSSATKPKTESDIKTNTDLLNTSENNKTKSTSKPSTDAISVL